MRRVFRLEIPLSKEELEKIKRKSENYGMTASSFARLVLLNAEIRQIVVNGKV